MEIWQLKQMQSLPLEVKILKTKQRIIEWYEAFEGNVYISFSGGKDSTVLLHIAKEIYPNISVVFADTGLEYPELREFVKSIEGVTILKPKMNFKKVIMKYGYPVSTKEQAHYIDQLTNNPTDILKRKLLDGIDKRNNETRYKLSKCWYKLLDAPFKVSGKCCNVMKKEPFRRYERKTGEKPIVGIIAGEAIERQKGYLRTGCNSFKAKRPISKPLGFWSEQDVLLYLKKYDKPYCKEIYGEIVYNSNKLETTKCDRTGCMFCAFGVHLEKGLNRFQRMQLTHPKIHEYCINELNLGMVLDYIGVQYIVPKLN